MDNKTLKEFMERHHTLVEDIRAAITRLPIKKEAVLIDNLRRAADELAQYDHFLCKEYTSPFKVKTMNEAVKDAVPAWKEQQDWEISENGDLTHKKRGYLIEAWQLKENDWLLHMMEKGWVNLNTFVPAYLEACRRAGINKISIMTHYGK